MLNTVMNAEQLERDVCAGRWDEVLLAISGLRLPLHKLMNLYEQIVREMLEVREVDVARAMMKETGVFAKMKQTAPERFKALDALVNRIGGDGSHIKASFSSNEEEIAQLLYAQGGKKENRRKDIAMELMREIPAVEPSRLLALMTKALRYTNEHEGLFANEGDKDSKTENSESTTVPKKIALSTQYDLFLGRFPTDDSEEEKVVKAMATSIKFGTVQSAPEAVRFSPDGSMMLTGARDGFVEVYNPYTCRLRDDLAFQANENFMALSSAVLAFSFNKTAQYVVAGTQGGTFAIFRLASGECVKEFANFHSAPISSVSFSRDDSAILSSSLDGAIHLSGLKSGKIVKTFRPDQGSLLTADSHPTFVISAHFNRDNSQVVAAYADGAIRIYSNASAQLIRFFEPGDNPVSVGNDRDANKNESGSRTILKSRDIHSLLPLPHPGQHQFIVGSKTNHLYLMNIEGQTLRTYANISPVDTSGSKENRKNLTSDSLLPSISTDGEHAPGAYTPFVAATLSPQAHYLYAVTQDSYLVCFDVLTGERVNALKIHDSEVIGLHHHPFKNLLLSFSTDGTLKTWKP